MSCEECSDEEKNRFEEQEEEAEKIKRRKGIKGTGFRRDPAAQCDAPSLSRVVSLVRWGPGQR